MSATRQSPGLLSRALRALVEMRPGEAARAVPLAAAHGLVLGSLSVLKPARNSLFLDEVGVARLPYVLMLVALFGGMAAALFGRFAESTRVDRLVRRSYLALIAMLVAFRLLLPTREAWVYYTFFVWVSLYGLFAVSLVWLHAGAIFDSRQARRLFGFIGTGGIAGAIGGGLLTSIIASFVGTENLLLVCATLLAFALILLERLPPPAPSRRSRKMAPQSSTLAMIATTPLLRLLAMTVALTAAVSVIVDVQFNEVVSRSFASRDAKTAFFGQFFAALSALAFAVQLFVTPRALRARGAVFALGFLPIGMALGSLGLFAAPGLVSAVIAKASDGGLRYSLNKAGTEMLFLPIPSEVKQRTKVLLDAAVDALASGVGAALVWVLTRKAGVSYPGLSFASLVLIVPWIFLTMKMRGAYVDAFRKALEQREIDQGQLRLEVSEAQAVRHLATLLDTQDQRQLLYALDLLSSARDPGLVPRLLPLLQHPDSEVRLRAIGLLSRTAGPSEVPRLEELLRDPSSQVRDAAMRFVIAQAGGERLERLRGYLADPRPEVWLGAIIWIGNEGGAAERGLIQDSHLAALMGSAQDETDLDRAQVARALGALGDARFSSRLLELAGDRAPEVVDQAIGALGRMRDPSSLPWLVQKLGEPRHRRAAREALIAFGAEAVVLLASTLADPDAPDSLRRQIPRVLAELPAQSSVDALLDALGKVDPTPRLGLLRALNRLRRERPDLRFDRARLRAATKHEAKNHWTLLRAADLVPKEGEGGELLRRAIAERQQDTLERIFRLLGLRFPVEDMTSAFAALVSSRPQLRSSALELLDNVLTADVRELIWTLIDQDQRDRLADHGARVFGETISTAADALRRLATGEDPWLRACSIFAAAQLGIEGIDGVLAAAKGDRDARVRETAEHFVPRAV
jgi:ATP:ADP antiporter, AAA family